VAARTGLETLVVIQFLVPEYLDAARVDQVQVADLVGGRDGVARDQALAAGEAANQPSCRLSRLSSYSLWMVSGVWSMALF